MTKKQTPPLFYRNIVNKHYDNNYDKRLSIGDSISSDISGGRDYGMHTCLYQKSENSERSDHGAEHVVKSLAEIKNIL